MSGNVVGDGDSSATGNGVEEQRLNRGEWKVEDGKEKMMCSGEEMGEGVECREFNWVGGANSWESWV